MYKHSQLVSIKQKLKKPIISILIILLISGMFSLYGNLKAESNLIINEVQEEVIEEYKEEIKEDLIEEEWMVDVKGKIYNPGTYLVKENMRVIDAILLAGGLLDDADTSNLNLSKKVEDQMVIIVLSKEEIKKLKEVPQIIENDASIEFNTKEDLPKTEKISINKASKEQLMTLKGIGEVKAQSIIEYIKANGPLKSIDELLKVSGISDKTFNEIKDKITL